MKVKVISLMILAFLFLGMASAAENVDYSNETKNITFEGVNFTIPVGFGESKGNEDFNDLGSNGQTCFYVNEFNGEIIITVISDWMGMSLNELYKDGAIKSKVNMKDGIILKMTSTTSAMFMMTRAS